jgi:hypothetical protein
MKRPFLSNRGLWNIAGWRMDKIEDRLREVEADAAVALNELGIKKGRVDNGAIAPSYSSSVEVLDGD